MGSQESRRVCPPAYPIALDLQYKLLSNSTRARVPGSGRTITFSSREVVFSGDQPVPANCSVQLSICWPALLDKRIRLQLVIEGHVTSVCAGAVTVGIARYHFRTRGVAASAARLEDQCPEIATFPANVRPVLVAAHA